MKKIKIMLNGLPGNVVQVVTRRALVDHRMQVLPYSLTGPDIATMYCQVGQMAFHLIRPDQRDKEIDTILQNEGSFISVDFTHPTAINANAEFYCRHNLPFVMGTTGGDRTQLAASVRNSAISAVIAPNMAKQIVGFQAMMAFAAETFPNLFKSYHLTIRESHQSGKADTSGTAKAMVDYFNLMGIDFTADQIDMERDPGRQLTLWGVPAEHLKGHAWHTYTLTSADHTVQFEFKHNVNGREIYGEGSMDAVVFLARKVAEGQVGQVYSMIDVLKQGELG